MWGPSLQVTIGDELHVSESCPRNLRALVQDTLIPLLLNRGNQRIEIDCPWKTHNQASFIPLLETSDHKALAAIYRTPRIAEAWWLPVNDGDADDFDFAAWIRAALDAWHEQNPDRFPGAADWARSKEWMTSEEVKLQASVDEAQAELERQQAALRENVRAAEAELAEAQMQVDKRERVLLTGQGDELVDAVHSMLARLGFAVEDVDKVRAAEDVERGGMPRPKLEDLRVSDPEASWRALAEVKGYTGGGKTTDFQKISRFVALHQARNDGALPDSTWYVVNQFLDKSPDVRPLLMEHQAEDVDVFASDNNGVLIDTRDLFVLDRHVASGDLTKEAARALLMEAKRRFTLDDTDN